MGQNIIDKIWDAHVVSRQEGVPDVLFIDLQFIHEVTSPQAFSLLREQNLSVLMPHRNVATLDHSVPTDIDRKAYIDNSAKNQVDILRKNVRDFGLKIFDFGSGDQGIVHVIGPELGLTQPGKTIVCGDSHTSTHGAFGALAFGIGTTQVAHVLATQSLLLERPKTMKVLFKGEPSPYFTSKDAILCLINQIGIQGANGYAMEYCGNYIQNLSMEGRMTICNMSIEAGGRFGIISPDTVTIDYLKGRPIENIEKCSQDWKKWSSDENASYDRVIEVDIEGKKPMVTWGTNPEQSVEIDGIIPLESSFSDEAKKFAAKKSLEYNQLNFGMPIKDVVVDTVFVGSCTNGRIEDMREVARILESHKVHESIKMVIVPGSEKVRSQCEKEGLIQIFLDAGAEVRFSGCSMCIAMNGDQVGENSRCASTSNRNFMGRQGKGSFTHLMSPMMAALAGVKGKITDPYDFFTT